MTMSRIVVGVDGSPPSLAALRWALAEAGLRGATVEAAHVWDYPFVAYTPAIMPTPAFVRSDLEAEARAELDQAVEEALAGQSGEGPPVKRLVVEGGAAQRLVERAMGAELLVVGHRGRGGFVDLLLGSVAMQCSTHASCPVVVVREGGERPADA